MGLGALCTADEILSQASKALRLVSTVQPTNEADQRDLFFSSKQEPKFNYRRFDPVDLRGLDKLRLPDTYWGNLLQTQSRRLLRLKEILSDSSRLDVRDFSREVFGAPSERLQSAARKILKSVAWEPTPLVSWHETKSHLEDALALYRLDGWKVVASPGDFTAARAVERTIYLTPVGKLYAETGPRLAVHEVGVHAVRAYNGTQQPLSHFGFGLPGYEATEEGLATYAELHTGTISPLALRNYAARVLAVASLDKGRSFRQCFDHLQEHGIDSNISWETSVRAYRGGGLYKDHIYLQGLLEVFAHMNSGGKWSDLYVGKVGLQHLPEVRRALESGELRPPAVLPEFVHDEPKMTEHWRLVRGLVE